MKSILCFIIGLSAFACAPGRSQDIGSPTAPWATPSISTAHIRTEPRHGSEMSSQALMGTPLKVISVNDGGWCRVETPEGYDGYINGNTLSMMDDRAFTAWRTSPRMIITSPYEVKAYADTVALDIVSDLVPGCIVEGEKAEDRQYTEVKLPDGRYGYVRSEYAADLAAFAEAEPSARLIVDIAKAQTGAPYLWGGLSSKGMDCSGLTKMAYYGCGIILPRDASQQASEGTAVDVDSLMAADLLFFGNKETRHVNHVGIYDSDGCFIEAAGMVKRSPLSHNDNFLYARRILGVDSTILTIKNHPWYFVKQ